MKELSVGFADGLITPVLNGTFLDGYGFRETPADSVRDQLHAKVMAAGDGENTFLLFSLDLLALIPRLYKLISRQITAITGVPAGGESGKSGLSRAISLNGTRQRFAKFHTVSPGCK